MKSTHSIHIKSVLFLLVFSLFVPYTYAQKTKKVVEKTFEGKKTETYYVLKKDRHIKEGIYLETFRGTPITKGQYHENKKTGEWLFYDYKRNSHFLGSFEDGKKTGKWSYFSNDQLVCESYYTWGRKDSCFASSNNMLVYELRYSPDSSGLCKTYYLDGSINEIIPLFKGKKEGVQQIYFRNGQLHREILFKDGLLKEVISSFDISGKPVFGGDLKDGSGSFYEFYIYNMEDGDTLILKSKASYKDQWLWGDACKYYPDGTLKSEGKFQQDKMVGVWKRYEEDGNLKKEIDYGPGSQKEMAVKVYNNNDPYGISYSLNFNDSLIKMPDFQGGENEMYRFVNQNINYPTKAKKKGQSGRVFATFKVSSIGEIYDVEILRGVSPLIDQEVLKVIKMMPRWNPGSFLGKPLVVQYRMPIKFSLD